MIGWLVEQQQLRLHGECERERSTFALATRGGVRRTIVSDIESMQKLIEPRFGAPAFALVANVLEATTDHEALAQRARDGQVRLLLDHDDVQAVLHRQLAVVERLKTRNHFQER